MSDKIKTNETDDIIIYWDSSKCQHAAECVHGAGHVFNTKLRESVRSFL